MNPDTTQFSYNNSGRQYIRGVSNQTGYVKGNGNGIINLGNLGTSSFTQSQSVADNIAPRSDETRFLSYQNSGNQYIHGVTNQTGYVMGNGNGIFNGGYLGASSNNQSHREVDLTATVDALRNLIARESRMGDGMRTQVNSSSPSTLRGENHQPHNFSNTGEQTIRVVTARIMNPDTTQFSYNNSGRQYIRGVSNQTGYVKGNGNGIINLGNLGTSSFTQSQSVADNIAPRSDETRFLSYQNSGNQYIHGVANQMGYVTGNGNGIINLGYLGASSNNQSHSVADLNAMVVGLQGLIGLVDCMDEGRVENDSATQLHSSCPNHRLANYVNTGRQTIKGLINQMGIIEGNLNGLVNLGSVIYAPSYN
ncbi:hypothetical protein L6164_026150 [Bauhinia variegata]|uniref:Uncharacterized protein n=1 Tax=Bauhinia variegata TaxID=167791 RepID=A0ACB9LQR6_BAUVA|nr:hypothetical protein L6164_026150 [Bauhinia variegata]